MMFLSGYILGVCTVVWVMRHALRIVRYGPVCDLPDKEDEWIRNPDVTDADLVTAWDRIENAPVCVLPNNGEEEE